LNEAIDIKQFSKIGYVSILSHESIYVIFKEIVDAPGSTEPREQVAQNFRMMQGITGMDFDSLSPTCEESHGTERRKAIAKTERYSIHSLSRHITKIRAALPRILRGFVAKLTKSIEL
jgi:hypothetical protein